MSRNIRVIFVILSVIFFIFTFQIIRFYSDEDRVLFRNEPETLTVSNLGGGYYSFAQRGFYGVKNSKGKVIIDASWKSIDRLEDDRFIVSVSSSWGDRYGIIDNAGNVVVPFIYCSFRNYLGEILSAETENGKYVLFDCSGDVLINEEWDSITKNYPSKPLTVDNNYVQLVKDDDFYRVTLDDSGRFIMSGIWMYKDVFGEKQLIKIKNTSASMSLDETHRLYGELFDRSVEYIGALFNNDSAGVKNLAWGENYRDLLLEGLNLRGGELTGIDTPRPEITDTREDQLSYICYAAVTYRSPDDVRWDGTYTDSPHSMTLDIHFRKKQDGKLAITKVYASRKD